MNGNASDDVLRGNGGGDNIAGAMGATPSTARLGLNVLRGDGGKGVSNRGAGYDEYVCDADWGKDRIVDARVAGRPYGSTWRPPISPSTSSPGRRRPK
jgi:hypothetical protein